MFFIEIDMLILKSMQEDMRPRIAKTIFKKKNKVGGTTLLDSKTSI